MAARASGGIRLLEITAWIGALGLIGWPTFRKLASRWHVHHPEAARESAIDMSLKQTFPASDPPASRYVDIPVNRR